MTGEHTRSHPDFLHPGSFPARPADEPLTVSAAYDGDPARVAEACAVARGFLTEAQAAFEHTLPGHTQETVQLVVSELLPTPAATHQAAACSP
ncbi:hypothetical protein JL475_32545 [Streptomyces sp. M2CJ-2]|uniref:hypothetical protein n=1 Tax=Streptomyces sp. M2CJ-2 TaxID=2803948 RepID=UPI001927A1BC|nr:hypothetical protein [Streptomyces sp. M2CJ-2]MBL3670617.1 hypothetical protein [Streptomyces sp. M2CJ-2]